jgi:biopolymer transport protein ExbB
MKKLRTSLFSLASLALMTAVASAAEGGVKEKTLLMLFEEGGWVMYPITIASVAMIWFIVDGWIRTSVNKLYPASHVTQLRELFQRGDYPGAYTFAKNAGSPVAEVVRAGVAFTPDGKVMTEEAIISEVTRIQGELMGRASYLSVIGVCTPMIGLTGTVTGMMKAFDKLGSSGVGDPSQLAGAIGEVLVATASGLFIAIPAFICYYLLRNRITKGIHDIQEIVTGLFRAFPYDEVAGHAIGDEVIYAAKPDWNASPAEVAPEAPKA